MKNFVKKLSAMALCTVFASMQIASATIDTGLNNAVINNTDSNFTGLETGNNSATLNFKGDSHVNWNTLNVGKNETLNFNATNPNGNFTILNTVNSDMSKIYGTISSGNGIGKLIISNPNGMLFDGAKFTTMGDLHLTTQPLTGRLENGNLVLEGSVVEAVKDITIKNGASFDVGGKFTIVAPTIEAANSILKAVNGVKLVTRNGQDFLVCPTADDNTSHSAVRLQSVQIDGDIYILSGEDIVKIANGANITGDLTIDSQGSVALNYVNNGATEELVVKGNVNVTNDGEFSYLRNARVTGNVDMKNNGGYLEIAKVNIDGNTNLITTVGEDYNKDTDLKHYVHVVGDNRIGGNLDVDSIHNVHIGGYDETLTTLADGILNVTGNINALAREGSVAVTIDTNANEVSLTSGTLNIISNNDAVIKANKYQFKANGYIGGINEEGNIINSMEYYTLYPSSEKVYLNIAGGDVAKIETAADGYAVIKSANDMNVNGVNAGKVHLTSMKDIVIGEDASADFIQVDGDTRNLTVKLADRDYTLRYINIKDTEQIVIDPKTEITYDMANGQNGWNKGIQTSKNTHLVVPGNPPINPPVDPPVDPVDPPVDPVDPPVDPVDPPVDPIVPPAKPDQPKVINPEDNDNVKIMKNLTRDQANAAIDAGQVYTPVAFAADLDEEIETGVRKNVDGSVTVVRPFTPAE